MRIFFRILKYLKPYWFRLSCSILCILLFTLFNGASLMSVMPFLNTIFHSQNNTVTVSEGTMDSSSINPIEQAIPGTLNKQWKTIKSKLYDFFSGENRREALQRVCIFIIILIFFKNIFSYLQSYLMAFVEQGVIRDIRNDIYSHINNLSLSYYHRTRTGQIISRITNDVTLVNNGVSASFVTMIKNPLMIIIALSLAVMISWKLTLIAMVVAPFSLVIIGWISLKLRKQSKISQEKMANVTSVLQESISGVRIVKAFAMENFEIKKFKHETQQFFKVLLRITRTRNLSSPLTEFLGTSVAVGILWFGGDMVLKGQLLTPDEFIFFLLLIFSIMQPVKELSSVNNRIQEALAAGERIFKVLDLESDIKNPANPVHVKDFNKSIEFIDVSFSYNNKVNVLENISVNVQKGEILAIVGPSGAGKSTFVDLLPRFYDPVDGRILLDGINLTEIDLGSLRRLMGFVTQETILFNDTVRNNIAYGLTDKSLEQVIQAAKIANAHGFIKNLSQGYDTNIGERGVTLSGGQRQRLAIARAILKNPPLLILDEATSALDTESELLVQQAIERLMKNRTSFVIAHRLSTILNADRIVVLDNGKIVQLGKHDELVNVPGLYQKLYNMQFKL
ncbi:ABC transporter ATP-binding protein [candidate division KSB1 bacterium]|nr:ABC transporter ATP-binding protein [candidate division KSB1 bacterium]